jgi:hypothetical protein
MQIGNYKEELSPNIVLRSLVETLFKSNAELLNSLPKEEIINSTSTITEPIPQKAISNSISQKPPPLNRNLIIVDGIWGLQTMRALQEFLVQQGAKITVDG